MELKQFKISVLPLRNKLLNYARKLTESPDDAEDAAVKLADWGVKEVLLTLGDKGSLIYVDERFYEIPAYPVENVADATGCGDTYMAGYLYMRKRGASYQEAGCFAAAMCSVKLQSYGPFGGTEEDVHSLIKKENAVLTTPKIPATGFTPFFTISFPFAFTYIR